MINLEMLRGFALKVGPYLLIELLLPGGSLLAMSLLLYQLRNKRVLAPAHTDNEAARATEGVATHSDAAST